MTDSDFDKLTELLHALVETTTDYNIKVHAQWLLDSRLISGEAFTR